MVNDAALRADVVAELEWEPRVEATHIGVACEGGIVTLSGHVASLAEKAAIERAVRRVRGVKAIALELEVRVPADKKTGDDEIAQRAVKILEWDPIVPDDRIRIAVEDGVVTLSGTVDWRYQSDEAVADMRKLGGVRDVVDRILVEPVVRAGDVSAAIKKAFQRNAELDASHVTVMVEDGKVVLGGKVAAWTEREAAEKAAWSAPGVVAVEDRIAIARP